MLEYKYPIKKLAIVLSDFRLPMLLATYQLHKQFPNSKILVHQDYVHLNDFGDNSPSWYKNAKLRLLRAISNIKIIKRYGEIEQRDLIGVNSSLISITNDSKATKKKYAHIYKRLEQLASATAGVAESIIEEKYDCVAIFNGRFSSAHPNLWRCEEARVNVIFYEYGTQPFHYTITTSRIHDQQAKAKLAIKLYECPEINPMSFEVMQSVGRNVKGKLQNKFSEGYSETCVNEFDFCLFLGSSHEFMSLDTDNFLSNVEIVKKVAKSKFGQRGAIRAHPNQIQDPSWRIESNEISEICSKANFKHFPPDSSINSYQLIKNSKLTVVTGSSIAIDAVIMGAEVEFMSRSIFRELVEYVEENFRHQEKPLGIAQLLSLSSCVWQVPYHPRLIFVFRILHRLDVKISKPPILGSQVKSKSS